MHVRRLVRPREVHLCFFGAPAAADDTARALRSDCSLPFLSVFSLKRGSHRRIKARFTPMQNTLKYGRIFCGRRPQVVASEYEGCRCRVNMRPKAAGSGERM